MPEDAVSMPDWRLLHPAETLPLACLAKGPLGLVQALVRQRVQALYLGPDRVLSRTLGRYKAFYDPSDLGFAGHVILDGFWEIWLTRFILGQVRPGMHFLDVGANFGYYSLLMSDLVGPSGQGWAVEPNPHTAGYLTDSLALNGFATRTRVVRSALADAPAESAHFFVPRHEPKNACLVPPGFSRADGEVIEVPVTTLDLLLPDTRVDFVKIDAEGAERGIFAGMQGMIRRCRPRMVVEFNARRGDAAAFLGEMIGQYGRLRYLHSDGELHDVESRRLLEERLGEDWLIYLADD